MATFDSTLSGSDEEILNALRLVNDITSKAKSTSSFSPNDEVKGSDLPDFSYNLIPFKTTVTDFSEDSGCPKLHKSKALEFEENLFYTELEHQNFLDSISTVQKIFNLCIESGRKKEAENNEQIRILEEKSKQILSESVLSENLANIQRADTHVATIAKKLIEIKQVLRNEPSRRTLKVNPSCQKSVIEFFRLANELMANLEKDKICIEACLENSVDEWGPANRQLQLHVSRILGDIVKRIDDLIEFRDNLPVLQEKFNKND